MMTLIVEIKIVVLVLECICTCRALVQINFGHTHTVLLVTNLSVYPSMYKISEAKSILGYSNTENYEGRSLIGYMIDSC